MAKRSTSLEMERDKILRAAAAVEQKGAARGVRLTPKQARLLAVIGLLGPERAYGATVLAASNAMKGNKLSEAYVYLNIKRLGPDGRGLIGLGKKRDMAGTPPVTMLHLTEKGREALRLAKAALD